MQYKERLLSIKSTILSLIKLWVTVVYDVEKLCVDKLHARKPRDFSLFNTSHEFLIDQNSKPSGVMKNMVIDDRLLFFGSLFISLRDTQLLL